MQLRPYQEELVKKVFGSWNKNKYVLASAPTGAGKTVIAFDICRRILESGKKVLFIVDREELIFQTVDKFSKIKEHISILKAGYESFFNPKKAVQIVMIQTWYSRQVMDLDPDYIIIDEVHANWGGKRSEELLATYKDAKVLGLSATPITEKGFLLEGFDDYVETVTIKELVEEGFLVKSNCLAPSELDLSDVRITGNDYNEKDLDDVLVRIEEVENVVNQYGKHACGLKTIVFANTITHAEALHSQFLTQGFKAEIIHSQLDDLKNQRKLILKRLETGETPILINVGILTTGFDCPSVECILLARPTKILRLYIQIAGRGLRACPEIGKKECLFLDCANIIATHGYPDDIRVFTRKPDKNVITVNEKKCPQCEMVLKKQAQECPYCGYVFSGEEPEITKKKEAQDLEKLKNLQDECLNLLYEEVKARNYKKGYGFWLLKDIAAIKPPGQSSYRYYNKVQTLLTKMSLLRIHDGKLYKLPWIIYRLSDQFGFKDTERLTTIGKRKDTN